MGRNNKIKKIIPKLKKLKLTKLKNGLWLAELR